MNEKKAAAGQVRSRCHPVQLQHTVNKGILALREAAQSPSSGKEPAA